MKQKKEKGQSFSAFFQCNKHYIKRLKEKDEYYG